MLEEILQKAPHPLALAKLLPRLESHPCESGLQWESDRHCYYLESLWPLVPQSVLSLLLVQLRPSLHDVHRIHSIVLHLACSWRYVPRLLSALDIPQCDYTLLWIVWFLYVHMRGIPAYSRVSLNLEVICNTFDESVLHFEVA